MKTKPDIRLIAIDLDGTLLDQDRKISQENKAAIAAAKAKPAAAPGENKKPAIPKPTTSAPRKRYVQYDLKQCAGTNTATAPHQLASRSQPRSRLPVQSACHLA